MASRPSEPILSWLRDTLKSKGMNVAALAEATGEKRTLVRKVLTGREPLTVDQLVSWTQTLEVGLEDLVGLDAIPEPEPEPEPIRRGPMLAAVRQEPPEDQGPNPFHIDPYALQAEQAIRLGFALGVDFGFIAATDQLLESGVPESVRKRFPERMLIKLEASYHSYNEPVYDEDELQLTLSFDTIRTCTFPWSSILQVTWYVEPPEPAKEPEPEAEPEPGRPMLRLVK